MSKKDFKPTVSPTVPTSASASITATAPTTGTAAASAIVAAITQASLIEELEVTPTPATFASRITLPEGHPHRAIQYVRAPRLSTYMEEDVEMSDSGHQLQIEGGGSERDSEFDYETSQTTPFRHSYYNPPPLRTSRRRAPSDEPFPTGSRTRLFTPIPPIIPGPSQAGPSARTQALQREFDQMKAHFQQILEAGIAEVKQQKADLEATHSAVVETVNQLKIQQADYVQLCANAKSVFVDLQTTKEIVERELLLLKGETKGREKEIQTLTTQIHNALVKNWDDTWTTINTSVQKVADA